MLTISYQVSLTHLASLSPCSQLRVATGQWVLGAGNHGQPGAGHVAGQDPLLCGELSSDWGHPD